MNFRHFIILWSFSLNRMASLLPSPSNVHCLISCFRLSLVINRVSPLNLHATFCACRMFELSKYSVFRSGNFSPKASKLLQPSERRIVRYMSLGPWKTSWIQRFLNWYNLTDLDRIRYYLAPDLNLLSIWCRNILWTEENCKN